MVLPININFSPWTEELFSNRGKTNVLISMFFYIHVKYKTILAFCPKYKCFTDLRENPNLMPTITTTHSFL